MPNPPSRRFPLDPALVLGALTALLHIATAADGWDLFRDELYYVANSYHLGWGYVDHPPMIGWLTWLARSLFGTSQIGLRLLPAVAGGATAFVVAKIASALGGTRGAQALAALAVALTPGYVSMFGFLSMNAFDILFWALGIWTVVRLLATRDFRWWLAFGVVAGLGLLNKISVLFLGVGVVAGLLLARDWEHFRSRWLWIGGGIATLLFSPHIVWQVAHGWPTLEFIHNATGDKILPISPLGFVAAQIDGMGYPTAVLAAAGTIFLFTASQARRFRPLAWTPLVVLALLIIQRSKPYYFLPAWSLPLAAGGVAVVHWCDRKGWRWAPPAVGAAIVLFGVVAAPLAKPILDVEGTVAYMQWLGAEPGTDERKEVGRLGQFYADRLGWRELASTVAGVQASLPPEDRERACVFGLNYGQAGAIEVYGRELGLPPAIAGHNSYWLWGPGDCTGDVLIILGGPRDRLESQFESVELAATYSCADCMPYEASKQIWIARGLRLPVDQAWAALRHYD